MQGWSFAYNTLNELSLLPMSLSILPNELISHCAFHLIAQSPLGPPNALIPLALTSRSFHHVVTANPFLAKICRLKFDVRPLTRRLFRPRDRDLADELVRCCRLIHEIRRADVAESDSILDDTFMSAYILMLSNDGKNYAQLEHAGLHTLVDNFVRSRLWEGRHSNQGWPLDTPNNSVALWLLWMTLTKEKLSAETPTARDEMTILTLPYAVIPHRYASASAPPNHFNLPLDPRNPCHQHPLVTKISPSTSYPIYLDQSSINIHYFNARIPLTPPLITIAAKLLFAARKDMSPIRAPPHLPQSHGPGIVGMTQDDFREFNNCPGARLCRVVTWDWDTGSPKRVGGDPNDGNDIDDPEWEESKAWDTEWWRRLLCGDCEVPRPKFLPGDLYKLGCMRGSWHGREYVPQGTSFIHFLNHPDIHYPGVPDALRPNLLTEASLGLSTKPVFLEVQEHHKICECTHTSDSHPYVASASNGGPPLPITSHSGRCGVVPIPAPLVLVTPENPQEPEPDPNDQNDNQPELQPSDAITLSLPTPSQISVIDYSMSNAWFPGHVGGVSFAKLSSSTASTKRDKIICAIDFQPPDVKGVLTRPEESECLSLGGRRRDGQRQREKMNAYVYETYDPDKVSVHRGLEIGDPISSGAGAANSDPHKCSRCVERENFIRLERKKAEQHSKMMLDVSLKSYERVPGYDWNQDWDYDMDLYYDVEGDGNEEMQDLDVSDLAIDLGGIDRAIAEATASSGSAPTPTRSQSQSRMDPDENNNNDDDDDDDHSSSSQIMSFGDDLPGEPGIKYEDVSRTLEPTRKLYDRSRIGVECRGVGDIVLNGQTGPRHAVWPQFTMYGRVRPWDGLIGIMRSSNTSDANIFIFGYLVGDNNFVGEWRVASSEPLRPTWAGAFVMSRRAEETVSETRAEAPPG